MKYGFIGCGNMGGAIASALATGDVDFVVSDRSGKAKDSGFPYCTPREVAQQADRIFLAVKPQMMADVLAELSPILARRRPVLISMAAGLTMSRIASMAGGNFPVIRIMPNTPVAVGFIHVPYLPEQGQPNMELEVITKALEAAIEAI